MRKGTLRKTAGNSGNRYGIAVNKTRRKFKMRRLYNSEYTGIPAYLMDFGFGGFLGYGKGLPVGLVNEELKKG